MQKKAQKRRKMSAPNDAAVSPASKMEPVVHVTLKFDNSHFHRMMNSTGHYFYFPTRKRALRFHGNTGVMPDRSIAIVDKDTLSTLTDFVDHNKQPAAKKNGETQVTGTVAGRDGFTSILVDDLFENLEKMQALDKNVHAVADILKSKMPSSQNFRSDSINDE